MLTQGSTWLFSLHVEASTCVLRRKSGPNKHSRYVLGHGNRSPRCVRVLVVRALNKGIGRSPKESLEVHIFAGRVRLPLWTACRTNQSVGAGTELPASSKVGASSRPAHHHRHHHHH